MPASFGDSPRRMLSTMKNEQRLYRLASPRPVEPAAPTSLSTYSPAPRMGESPTRPGIFQASPLVVVTPQMSPVGPIASQLMVPQKLPSRMRPSRTIDRPAASARDSHAGPRRRCASTPSPGSRSCFGFGLRPSPFGSSQCSGSTPPLPLEPQLPRLGRVQVVLDGEAHLAGELLRPVAREQVVVRVVHHGLRHERRRAHALDGRHAAGALLRAVHAAGVELDHAVGVGQPAVADAGLERVELRDVDAGEQRVQHVLAFGDEPEGALDGVLGAAVLELPARQVGDHDGADRARGQDLWAPGPGPRARPAARPPPAWSPPISRSRVC